MPKGSSDSSRNAWSNDRTRARRSAAWTAIVPALIALPAPARADEPDTKRDCIKSYEESQVLRQQGQLTSSRQSLKMCARQECPAMVRADCGTWLEEVERALPSIIVKATLDGVETLDVKVTVDGKEIATRLDGKAISVDPGAHSFHFEAAGLPPIDANVLIREGERYRAIPADFVTHKAPLVPEETARPVPATVWIFGGVAIAATASFVVWGLAGNARRDTLREECAPFCTSNDASSVNRRYLAADISLGVAVLSLGAASYFYFTRPSVPVRVGVGVPSSRGFGLTVAGDL